MRLPEQKLWDVLASHVPRDCWLQRVENGVGAGMPDVLMIDRMAQTPVHWIELKVNESLPVRSSTPALGDAKGLGAEQVNWHIEWGNHGGSSWILIGLGRGKSRELALVPGRCAREVNGLTLGDLRSAFKVPSWVDLFKSIRYEQ